MAHDVATAPLEVHTGAMNREEHIEHWNYVEDQAAAAWASVVNDAMDRGERRIPGTDLDYVLAVLKDMMTEAQDQLHWSVTMQLDTAAMEAKKADVDPDACVKCNGTGFIPGLSHVANGICFSCGGKG